MMRCTRTNEARVMPSSARAALCFLCVLGAAACHGEVKIERSPCPGFELLIKEQDPGLGLRLSSAAVRLDMTLECRPGMRPQVVAEDVLVPAGGRFWVGWPTECDSEIIQARGSVFVDEARFYPATVRFELDDIRCRQRTGPTVHCKFCCDCGSQ
jgi:hypothetical protein